MIMIWMLTGQSSGWAAEDAVSKVAKIPCISITRETLGGLGSSFYFHGEAFGVPETRWNDEIAAAFRRKIDSCFGDAAPDGDHYTFQAHFDAVWDTLGPDLRAKKEAAERELTYEKERAVRAAQQAAKMEEARLKEEAAQEAAAQVTQQAAAQAAQQAAAQDAQQAAAQAIQRAAEAETARAELEAKQKRARNPACVEADRLKQALNDRAGGDVANLIGVVVMAHQMGASDRACSIADALSDDISELRAASEDCDAGDATQLAAMGRNLYSMRDEMGCLGWLE